MFLADKIDQVYAANPENLFRELGKGGNGSPADAVEIAVDAGVYTGHRNGERNDAKKRGSPLLQKKIRCDRFRIYIDAERAGCGERHRHKKACPECTERIFIIAGARFARHIFGDGGLYAGHGKRKREGQHGGDELVEAHALRAEHIG